MEIREFKDRLLDILNDMDDLPIDDLIIHDRNGIVNVHLAYGTKFSVYVENCGN